MGFWGLIGDPRAIGDTFHITSDEALTWDQIARMLAQAAGVDSPHIIHVPSDAIAALDAEWGAGLLGDKAHSMVFDNSKIKSLVPGWTAIVPFWQGAREIVDWHDQDPRRRTANPHVDQLMDQLANEFGTEQ